MVQALNKTWLESYYVRANIARFQINGGCYSKEAAVQEKHGVESKTTKKNSDIGGKLVEGRTFAHSIVGVEGQRLHGGSLVQPEHATTVWQGLIYFVHIADLEWAQKGIGL
jgi:hypothetical protein